MQKTQKKGIILIAAYLVVLVLFILGSVFVARSISEKRVADQERDSVQAFYLAEAGINRAIQELRANYNVWAGWAGANIFHNLENGQYSVVVVPVGNERTVTATGFIPNAANPRISRVLEANIRRSIPPNFYNNALYVAEEVTLNGAAYLVDGDIAYGTGPINNTDNVTGTVTQDSYANPLPLLDFAQLRSMSQTQGNVFNAGRLADVKNGTDSFPNSFWFDQANQIPNIVYVETDLELKGNIGTIGGFFVVAGDVITNPAGTAETSINGNGQIDGCIYTRGEFRINGGGGGLNVNGGVWANGEARLNGNATVKYIEDYMNSIELLNINADVQITSWREVF